MIELASGDQAERVSSVQPAELAFRKPEQLHENSRRSADIGHEAGRKETAGEAVYKKFAVFQNFEIISGDPRRMKRNRRIGRLALLEQAVGEDEKENAEGGQYPENAPPSGRRYDGAAQYRSYYRRRAHHEHQRRKNLRHKRYRKSVADYRAAGDHANAAAQSLKETHNDKALNSPRQGASRGRYYIDGQARQQGRFASVPVGQRPVNKLAEADAR